MQAHAETCKRRQLEWRHGWPQRKGPHLSTASLAMDRATSGSMRRSVSTGRCCAALTTECTCARLRRASGGPGAEGMLGGRRQTWRMYHPSLRERKLGAACHASRTRQNPRPCQANRCLPTRPRT